MAIRGQRFQLSLDSDDESETGQRPIAPVPKGIDLGFIRDIIERSNDSHTKPPSPPRLNSSETGFPAHKKRSKPSAIKEQRSSGAVINDGSSGPISTRASGDGLSSAARYDDGSKITSGMGHQEASTQTEREKIDQENRKRLAEMSLEEIERERQEVLSGLSSSLIERLLKRANIDEGRTDTLEKAPQNQSKDSMWPGEEQAAAHPKANSKRVTFDTPEEKDKEQQPQGGQTEQPDGPGTQDAEEDDPKQQQDETHTSQSTSHDPDGPPIHLPPDLLPASSLLPPLPAIHFPQPTTTSSPLDPSDPDFLQKLHSRYFPHLPASPTSLSWLAPPSLSLENPSPSSYSPSHTSLSPSSLRFDFRGRLLPPRLAAQIPVTAGLHHHGDAPEAAGYTIRELAHLSRSTVPAQRCVAMQTLGRVLYRLGRGDFGGDDGGEVGGRGEGEWVGERRDGEEGGDDEGAERGGGGRELYLGLWKCIEEGRVLETLMEEAGREEGRGNRSVWVTATEAVWLWQRGGGKRVRAG